MEDEIETELMHKKREKGFAKLEKDLDDFREYFNSTKNADVILTYANIMRMQETKFFIYHMIQKITLNQIQD